MAERILLVQLADIGDLVLATPAMRALRDAKPEARIDLLAAAHAAEILPDCLVDSVIAIDKGEWDASRALLRPGNLRQLLRLRRGYDALIILHHFSLRAGTWKFRFIARIAGAGRIIGLRNHNAGFLTEGIPDEGFGARHQAQYWLDLVGLLGADAAWTEARVKRQKHAAFDAWRESVAGAPIVVLHAGSGGYSRARRWSVERFSEVARELRRRRGAAIALVGKAGDDVDALAEMLDDGPLLDLAGGTSLPQLAWVLNQADLFIGADSGVMHLAAAVGVKVVAIFGPSNHEAWKPWSGRENAIVLRSGVRCSPCSYVGAGVGAREGCPARTCMKLVTSAQVIDAALNLLDGNAAEHHHERVRATETERDRVRILDVPVDRVTYDDWLRLIDGWVSDRSGGRHVCTVNPEFIMIARGDPIFSQILGRADLCVPDGVGLLWAARQLGERLPGRVTGSDGVPMIAERAAQRGWRIFFLGAGAGIARRAADILTKRHPNLQVAGVYGGSPQESEEDDIVKRVNASGADILFVAYGAPGQDKWIARNLGRLDVKMAMGVGGALDFIAGSVPRAPIWMRRWGLEWLYRLLRQPWRFRRMLRLPRFALLVWRDGRQRSQAAR